MKKYDIYGIGNALVDMECEVSDEFLTQMNVEKGLMTLVDAKRQNELVEALGGFKHKKSCGGSAANTVIAVSQFGGSTFYSCKVAGDDWGTFYARDLIKEGVDNNLGQNHPEGVTGKCLVMITPDAERSMNTYLGITETLSEHEICYDELRASQYLYIEGYLVTSPTGKKAAIKAREFAQKNNVKVAMTFSDPGIVEFFKDGFCDMIGEKIDLIFANTLEALKFTGESTAGNALEKLKKISHQIVITKGPLGALLYDGEKVYEIEAPKVEAVDANGAGDIFAGSFIYGITHGMSFYEAGKLATHTASHLVTKFGPRLTKEDVQKIKVNFY